MPIKCPTSGGQARTEPFTFYRSALMVRTHCNLYFAHCCTKHRHRLLPSGNEATPHENYPYMLRCNMYYLPISQLTAGMAAGGKAGVDAMYVLDIIAPNCFPAFTSRSLMCSGGWKYLHFSRWQRSWAYWDNHATIITLCQRTVTQIQ